MEKLVFMTNYKEVINERETIHVMKKHLNFIKEYKLTLASRNQLLQHRVEEKDVMDYLPYTRSILYQNKKRSNKAHSTRVLEAMERYEKNCRQNQKLSEERRQHYQWVMSGIQCLDDTYQCLLLDKYVYTKNNEQLCNKRNNISLSTLNRQLNKACLQLAILLELEVVK